MKTIRVSLPLILILTLSLVYGQSKIEWSEEYKLQASDFRAPAPNTGTRQTIQPVTHIDYEFPTKMFQFKNSNSVIANNFKPLNSWLDEGPHTEHLLRYAQTIFDLSEISARKLRKKFHENRMRVLTGKIDEYYNEMSEEMTALVSRYAKETDFGDNLEKQAEWEVYIQETLTEYADYCKSCKLPKKKKKKK
ncbi:MAG: hypothetical protein AAF388_17405 [Bacteroidota bacterium]